MTVPRGNVRFSEMLGEFVQIQKSVILSDRRESKDLLTDHLHNTSIVRRSFDALRLLRMTNEGDSANSPKYVHQASAYCGTAIAVPYIKMHKDFDAAGYYADRITKGEQI